MGRSLLLRLFLKREFCWILESSLTRKSIGAAIESESGFAAFSLAYGGTLTSFLPLLLPMNLQPLLLFQVPVLAEEPRSCTRI